MGTISDIISDVRIELGDTRTPRWTDEQLLSLIKRSIRRAELILRENSIQIGRAYETITTVAGEDEYDLPEDFFAPIGLYRDGTHMEIQLCDDETWEQIVSAAEISAWIIRGENIYITEAPTSVETLTLVYWPKLDLSSYDDATEMPWGGALDEAIVEYVALRCRLSDDSNAASNEQNLMQLEHLILSAYGSYRPMKSIMRGPFQG